MRRVSVSRCLLGIVWLLLVILVMLLLLLLMWWMRCMVRHSKRIHDMWTTAPRRRDLSVTITRMLLMLVCWGATHRWSREVAKVHIKQVNTSILPRRDRRGA